MAHTAHTEHTIHIHPQAPGKVPEGVACNGCGVCCLFEPCPLGVVLSRARVGPWNVVTMATRTSSCSLAATSAAG